MRLTASLVLLTASLALPSVAGARLALIATQTNDVALLDVATNTVVARPALPGPSTAVAVTHDGRRGFVAAGTSVTAIDLRTLRPADLGAPAPMGGGAAPDTSPGGALGPTRDLGAPIVALALSPRDGRLYVALGAHLQTLDATTLATLHDTDLRSPARALAVSRDGTLGAVTAAGNRVALVALGTGRLLRRVRVRDPAGVAFDAAGRAWVAAARGRLVLIRPGHRKAERHPLRLGSGVGGGVAASPDGTQLMVGPAGAGARAALVDVFRRHVRGIHVGRGPGAPGWSPDGTRIYLADRADATISLVSPFAHRRVGVVTLPGTAPVGIVVQPGLARVIGTDAPDVITGTRGRDLIEGLGGDDVLRGGRDNDLLFGGDGNDTLSGGSYDDRLYGDAGDDRLMGDAGNDRIYGGDGADTANGGTGNDSIHGGDGNDVLDGGPGDDHVFGEGGDDQIVETTFGNDRRLYGGPGNDLIKGGRGDDLIKGGSGDDELYGETGTENISGGDGNDFVDGGPARDLLYGNNGDDIVRGDAGDDTVDGGAGNDTVDGGSGDDEIYGGDGADTLIGGPGVDMIVAGPGDDTIRVADDSRDEVDCGDGSDTVYVEDTAPQRDVLIGCETVIPIPPEPATDTAPTSVIRGTPGDDVLYGTDGSDSIFGKAGRDKLFGKGGDDYVDGENGDDELHGGPGNDTIAGRSGDDRIYGDAGDDYITGDRGSDRIDGGPGNDQIFGNLDPDVIQGGPGDDRINVIRGGIDTVSCGPGRDVVFADPADRIAGDCESVRR